MWDSLKCFLCNHNDFHRILENARQDTLNEIAVCAPGLPRLVCGVHLIIPALEYSSAIITDLHRILENMRRDTLDEISVCATGLLRIVCRISLD